MSHFSMYALELHPDSKHCEKPAWMWKRSLASPAIQSCSLAVVLMYLHVRSPQNPPFNASNNLIRSRTNKPSEPFYFENSCECGMHWATALGQFVVTWQQRWLMHSIITRQWYFNWIDYGLFVCGRWSKYWRKQCILGTSHSVWMHIVRHES